MNDRSVMLRRAVIGALVLASAPALGQQTTQTDENARTIDTIIVTAQKREQSLQDVPIVVTAVSEQLLRDTGVKDIKDLAILAPGLTVTSTSSEASTTARIRGIGTVGDNPGLESSVGVVIDGVYRPRNGVAFGDLGELERIEVLKGPQGTLFGKNTSAGVINVISKRPQFDFGSDIELTTGNFSAMEGAASITGPIAGETVAGRLYVAARERDGYYDVNRGEGPRTLDDDWNRDFYTARGQLLLRPANNFEARIIADYTERDEACCGAVQMNVGPTAGRVAALATDGGVAIPADPFEYDIFSNRPTTQEIKDQGVSAELTFDIGEIELVSVTAWRNWEMVNGQDVDYSSADIFYRDPGGPNFTEFDQLSQELRLSGQAGKVSWLVGGFYAAEDLDTQMQLLYGADYEAYISTRFAPATLTTQQQRAGWLAATLGVTPGMVFPQGLGQLDRFAQESKSYALFTNNSIAFTDQLELTVGVRYTKEEKELDSAYNNLGGGSGCARIRQNLAGPIGPGNIGAQLTVAPTPPAAVNGLPVFVGTACSTANDHAYTNLNTRQNSIDEDDVSGTAKLAYRFSDEFMSYISYARGYKASGYNLDRSRVTPVAPSVITDTSFAEELVDSYELGVKTNLAGNSLLLNGAVFYQDYQDFQLNTFTGIQFVVRSLPQVVSQGVDLDMLWFTPLDQLSLQGGVTYAETEIEDFGTTLDPTQGVFSAARENDRLSFAPKWSASLSATFEQPVGNSFLFRANIGAKYLSEYNTGSNLDPNKIQDAYTIVNARVGFGAQDEKWMLEAWSLNLTDEEYVQVIFDAPAQTATYNAFLGIPQTYGLTARFRF